MDIDLAATHEAGHAVMQWLVGLEVGELQMTVKNGNASAPSARCPDVPVTALSDLRKRLLVLLAGNSVTLERWPNSWNDRGDWLDALSALKEYLKLDRIAWVINDAQTAAERLMKRNEPRPHEVDKRKTDNPEANAILQDAIACCREIISTPLFRLAIAQVAAAFVASPPGEDGVTRLEGPAAVAICEKVIGEGFRMSNAWSTWIAGEKVDSR
jgi:hypothetical protein